MFGAPQEAFLVGEHHNAVFAVPEYFSKPLVAELDHRQGSSDGAAILLKAADRRLLLTEALAATVYNLTRLWSAQPTA